MANLIEEFIGSIVVIRLVFESSGIAGSIIGKTPTGQAAGGFINIVVDVANSDSVSVDRNVVGIHDSKVIFRAHGMELDEFPGIILIEP